MNLFLAEENLPYYFTILYIKFLIHVSYTLNTNVSFSYKLNPFFHKLFINSQDKFIDFHTLGYLIDTWSHIPFCPPILGVIGSHLYGRLTSSESFTHVSTYVAM